MIRLLIADDHTVMREALKQLFSIFPDVELVGEAINGTQVLEQLHDGNTDLLLLDMSMPGICGEDLIARIRTQYAELRILILSMHNKPQFAMRALKAGANGYMTKDSDPDTLLAAVRQVAAGGRFLDTAIAESMAFKTSGLGDQPHHDCLSKREFQVLQMLSTGHSVNEIADLLAISNKTVSTHKARMIEKMGFDSDADLIRYAVTYRLDDE